jgi:hypothetical protein
MSSRMEELSNSRRCIDWFRRPTRGCRSDLYLEPAVSYQVAQQVAGAERLPVGEQTLRHRLRQRGLLASVDVARQVLLVRRTLEGSPRPVLHLKSSILVGPGIETETEVDAHRSSQAEKRSVEG